MPAVLFCLLTDHFVDPDAGLASRFRCMIQQTITVNDWQVDPTRKLLLCT
jgi:hypothetical protein